MGIKILVQQLSVETAKVQTQRRMGLLRQLQLCAMKFLLCQGLSLRGHIEKEGSCFPHGVKLLIAPA